MPLYRSQESANVTSEIASRLNTPTISLPKAGDGDLQIGGAGGWKMLVVYRGKHCPICRTYLKTLD